MNCESNCQPPKTLGQIAYEWHNELIKTNAPSDSENIAEWNDPGMERFHDIWERTSQYLFELGRKDLQERKPYLVDAYHPEPNTASTEMIWEDVTKLTNQLRSVLGTDVGKDARTLALQHLEDAILSLRIATFEMRNAYEGVAQVSH